MPRAGLDLRKHGVTQVIIYAGDPSRTSASTAGVDSRTEAAMAVAERSKTERIRELNDAFRRSFTGGVVVLTSGVDALPGELKTQVLKKVREFDEFTTDNDPYREHDFGAFELGSQRFFWKIDYYNLDMAGGSEDPADLTKTTRVLTIM